MQGGGGGWARELAAPAAAVILRLWAPTPGHGIPTLITHVYQVPQTHHGRLLAAASSRCLPAVERLLPCSACWLSGGC